MVASRGPRMDFKDAFSRAHFRAKDVTGYTLTQAQKLLDSHPGPRATHATDMPRVFPSHGTTSGFPCRADCSWRRHCCILALEKSQTQAGSQDTVRILCVHTLSPFS